MPEVASAKSTHRAAPPHRSVRLWRFSRVNQTRTWSLQLRCSSSSRGPACHAEPPESSIAQGPSPEAAAQQAQGPPSCWWDRGGVQRMVQEQNLLVHNHSSGISTPCRLLFFRTAGHDALAGQLPTRPRLARGCLMAGCPPSPTPLLHQPLARCCLQCPQHRLSSR